jgi:hypothetical protein
MPSSRLTAIQVEVAVSNSIFRIRSQIKMRISTLSFAQPHRAKSLFPLALLIALAAVLGPAADIAQAQKRKKLTAPIVNVTQIRPDVAELTITSILSTVGTRQEYQVISGPNAAGSPTSLTIGGVIQVGLRNVLGQYPIQLLPNSDYVVRVRNIKTSVDFSDWVNVSFRTAATFSTRQSAAQSAHHSTNSDSGNADVGRTRWRTTA